MKTDLEALIEIGNLVGAPTTHYQFPEQDRKELVKRLQKISDIVMGQLGVTRRIVDPEKTRQNPGIREILNGEFRRKE